MAEVFGPDGRHDNDYSLYYNHTWMKDVARSNEFGFDLFHGISFGAYYFF